MKAPQWSKQGEAVASAPVEVARTALKRAVRQLHERLLMDGIADDDAYAIVVRVAFLRHMDGLDLPRTIAMDLPGLFGQPLPTSGLALAFEAFSAPELADGWADDSVPSWVHQYLNDPTREALDAKLLAGGKLQDKELAAKTLFITDRYMVEWLLHNSIGQTWLCMCKKNGWTADADQVLDDLDRRRAAWREKRERGEVALDALMPIAPGLEDRWKYWVPQPMVDDAIAKAPNTVHDLTVMDPAVGPGVFLLSAFDLLVALYREEARHRSVIWSERQIAEWVIEKNLHGVDIDLRCTRLCAASLWLKAKTVDLHARPRWVNIVAPNLGLANLKKDDPTLLGLIAQFESLGIPAQAARELVVDLAQAERIGSLYQFEPALERLLAARWP